MYGRVDPTDDRESTGTARPGTPGRHRGRSSISAPLALGVTVTALLSAFGVGAAFLPESVTGSGSAAESRSAAIANLDSGQDGAAATETTPSATAEAPTSPPAPSSAPAPKRSASTAPAAKPSTTTPKPKATTSKPSAKVTAAKASSQFEAMENEVIALTNVERGKKGCGDLTMSTELRAAMRLHVQELAAHDGLYISHVSDDGRTFVDRAKAQGYTDLGAENVARGQQDPASVMTSWMNSEGHRANILNCDLKAIGVGVARGDGSLVWGQIFGNS